MLVQAVGAMQQSTLALISRLEANCPIVACLLLLAHCPKCTSAEY